MAARRTVLRDVRLPGDDLPVQLAIDDGCVVDMAPAVDADGADEVLDLDGRTVLPGLWDHHVHATQWASARARVDVSHAISAAEAAEAVRAFVTDPAFDRDVLVGSGMHHLRWAETPDRTMLDAVAPGVAVVVQGVDLHTAWASTAALERVGLADHPTGLLREGDCFHAIATLPEASRDQRDAWVADAMAAAARLGVTGIRDFEFGDPLGDWQRRRDADRLAVRVVANVYPDHLDAAIGRGLATGDPVPDSDEMLVAGHLKLFVDGALNSRTALCHDPYPGGHDHGSLEVPFEDLVGLMARAWQHGIAPAVHAIGDRAVALALDAFEQVGCPGRIEHAQLVADADVTRVARPGLVLGVQPAHAVDDRDAADEHWPGRTGRAYRFADLLGAGATLELGSDAPVSPLDPWRAVAAAVARTDDDRPPWHPEQRIGVGDALQAVCGGRLDLRPGDPADLVVLDDDPLRCSVDTLRSPGVWGTMLGGRWTHRQH